MPEDKLSLVTAKDLVKAPQLGEFSGIQTYQGGSIYDKGYLPAMGDIDNYRARQQGWLDKTLRYTGQGVSTFGTALLETATAIGSLLYAAPKAGVDALAGKDTQFLEDWISNPVMQTLEDINKWVQEEVLVGYEKKTEGLWASGTEFYRDFINAVGFAGSALVGTGAVVKGVGLAGKAIAGTSKALDVTGKAVSTASKIKRGLPLIKELQHAGKIQSIINNSSVLTGSIVARLGESAIEANGAVEEFIAQNPNATPQQIDQIRSDVFLMNMGLGLIDAFQYVKMFGTFKSVFNGFKEGERRMINQIAKSGADDFIFDKEAKKYVAKELIKPRRLLNKAKDISLIAASEAGEEVSQYNFNEISRRVALGEVPDNIWEKTTELLTGIANPASTPEELKSAILGGLLGGVMGGGAEEISKPTAVEKRERNKQLLDRLNDEILNLPVVSDKDKYKVVRLNGKDIRVLKPDYLKRLNNFSYLEELKRAVMNDEIVTKDLTAEQKRYAIETINANQQLSDEIKKTQIDRINQNLVEGEARLLTQAEKEAEYRKLSDLQLLSQASAHIEAGRFEEYKNELSYLLGASNEELAEFTGETDPIKAKDQVQQKINKLDEIKEVYDAINSDYLFSALPPSIKSRLYGVLVHQKSISDQIDANLKKITDLQNQLSLEVQRRSQIEGKELKDKDVNPEITKEIEQLQDANKKLIAEDDEIKQEYREWRSNLQGKVKSAKEEQDEIDKKRFEKEQEKVLQSYKDAETFNEFIGNLEAKQGTEIGTSTYSRRLFLEIKENGDFYAVSKDGYRTKITANWIRKQKARLLTPQESKANDILQERIRNREDRITAMEKLISNYRSKIKEVENAIEEQNKISNNLIARLSNKRLRNMKELVSSKGRLEKWLEKSDSIIAELEAQRDSLQETLTYYQKALDHYKELRKVHQGIGTREEELQLILEEDAKIEEDLPTLRSLYQNISSILPGLLTERQNVQELLSSINSALLEHVASVMAESDSVLRDTYNLNIEESDQIRRIRKLIKENSEFRNLVETQVPSAEDEKSKYLKRELNVARATLKEIDANIAKLESLPVLIARKKRVQDFLSRFEEVSKVIENELEERLRKQEYRKLRQEESDHNTSTFTFDPTSEAWEEMPSSPDFMHTTGTYKSSSPNQNAWQRLLSNNDSLPGYIQFHDASSPLISQVDKDFDPEGIWVTYHEPKNPEPWKDGDVIAYTSIPAGEKTITKVSDLQLKKAAFVRGITADNQQELLDITRRVLLKELTDFRRIIKENLKKGKVFHKADVLTKGHLPIAERWAVNNHHRRHSVVDTIPQVATSKDKIKEIDNLNIKVNTSYGEDNIVYFTANISRSGLPRGGVYLLDNLTNTVVQLRNRKLNNREVGTILALINEYKNRSATDTYNFNDKVAFAPKFLHTTDGMINSMIMWGQAGEDRAIKNPQDQIYFKDGKLYFGENTVYTKEQIENAVNAFFKDSNIDEPLVNFIRNRYHQVNQALLNNPGNTSRKYSAVYAQRTKDGYKLKRVITTYKKYLILGLEGVQQGRNITDTDHETDAPLSTNLERYDPKRPFRANRQVVLSPDKLLFRTPSQKKEETVEVKPEEKKPEEKKTESKPLTKEDVKDITFKDDDPFAGLTKAIDTPTELNEKPKPQGPVDNPYGGSVFERITDIPFVQADIEKEAAWFASKFPKIPFKVVNRMIGEKTFGKFYGNLVEVYRYAQQGTVYHEGFHVVFQLYLSDKERSRIYKEFRNRPDFQEKIEEVKRLYGDKSEETLIEEALAEEFTQYMLSDGKMEIPRRQRNFFQQLWNFIKSFFTAPDAENQIQELYDKIRNTPTFGTPVNYATESFERKLSLGGQIFSSKDSREIFEGFNFAFFRQLLKTNNPLDLTEQDLNLLDLYNRTFEEFDTMIRYSYQHGAKVDKLLNLSKESKINLINYHTAYLKQHGIGIEQFDEDGNPIEFDPEDFEFNDEEVRNRSVGVPHIYFDTKSGAPKSIKILLASSALVRRDANGVYQREFNSLGFPKLVEFDNLWNYIAQNLAQVPGGYEQFISELEKLSEKRPDVASFIHRIQNVGGPRASRLRTQFVQAFAKAKHDYFTALQRKDGGMVVFNSNTNRLQSAIKEQWRTDVREKAVVDQSGRLRVNPDAFQKSGAEFLSAIGINLSFTPSPVVLDAIASVKEAMRRIQEQGDSAVDIFELDHTGKLNIIAEEEASFTNKVVDLQHFSPDNKIVYGIALNTALTLRAKDLSYYAGNEEALRASASYLFTDPFLQNSQWRQHLLDGGKIVVDIMDGAKADSPSAVGKPVRKVSAEDKFAMDIIHVFDGKYPFLRAADRGIENVFTTGRLISTSLDTTVNLMKGYLEDEIRTIRENGNLDWNFAWYNEVDSNSERTRGDKLRIFDSILPESLKREIYNLTDNANDNAFEKGIDALVERAEGPITEFIKSEITEALKHPRKDTHFRYLVKEHGGVENVISLGVQNIMLGYIEQIKLFVGDLAFYKNADDAFKRFAMHNSPKKISRTDESMLSELSEFYRTSPRKDGRTPSNTITSITFEDIKVQSDYVPMLRKIFEKAIGKDRAEDYLKPYMNMTEGDAQGYVTMDGYRETLIRAGDWTDAQEAIFQKIQKGEKISPDEIAYFPVLKIQYAGPLVNPFGRNIPAGRKTSVVPLIPSAIKDTALANLEKQLSDNQIEFAFFESASKFGYRLRDDGSKNQLYDDRGILDIAGSVGEELDWRYMGVQLDMAPKVKNRTTQGTQFNIIKFSNLFRNGQIAEKIPQEIKDKVQESINIEAEITSREWNKAIDDLGFLQTPDGYQLSNPKKLVDFLESELTRREVDDNTIESLRQLVRPNNELRPLEASYSRKKIENLIHSVINSRVIRKKRFGGAKPQVASTGFHSNEFVRVKGKSGLYQSGELKFYRWNKDETKLLPMECMLPLPVEWMKYVEKLGGLGEFNRLIQQGDEALKAKGFDPRLLEVIGFRIPTQKLGSAEVMRVKKFLPPEAGDMIVVPSEIVAKAGSDFDIDKQNLYFANAVVTDRAIHFMDYITSTDKASLSEYFSKVYEPKLRFLESLMAVVGERGKEVAALEFNLTTEEIDEYRDELLDKKSESEFIKSKEGLEVLKANNKQQLENRLLEIEKDLLLTKENAFQLLAPINDSVLQEIVEDIRELRKESGTVNDLGSVIRHSTNLKKFSDYLSGKDGVAQTAINITTHVMAQMAGLEFNSGLIFFPTTDGSSLSNLYDVDGNLISETFSAFVNAYVDIAKDPYVFDINAGNLVANTIFYMVRLGISPKVLGRFINQPIIREYIKMRRDSQSAFNEESVPRRVTIEALKAKYKIKLPIFDGNIDKVGPSYLSKENYNLDTLGKGVSSSIESNKEYQAIMLDHFLEYERQSNIVNDMVRSLNANTKGVGKNKNALIDHIKDERKFYKTAEPLIINFDKLFIDGSYMHRYQQVRYEFLRAIGNLYLEPSAIVEATKGIIDSTIFDSQQKAKVKDLIDDEFITFLLQKYLDSKGSSRIEETYKKLFEGENSIAKQVLAAKRSPKLKDNLLIKELYAIVGKKGNPDYIRLFKGKLSVWESNSLVDAFNEIKETDIQLYRNLIRSNIIQSGMANSVINYLKVIPSSDFNAILDEAVAMYSSNPFIAGEFQERFFYNNPRYVQQARRSFYGGYRNSHATYKGPYIKTFKKVGEEWEIRLHPILRDENGNVVYNEKYPDQPLYDLNNYIVVNTSPTKPKEYAFTLEKRVEGKTVEPQDLSYLDSFDLNDDPYAGFTQAKERSRKTTPEDTSPEDYGGFTKKFQLSNSLPGPETKINIWAVTNENADLSNMAQRPFVYNGREFNSVEQAFQEAKLAYTDGSQYNINVHKQISESNNSFEAKKLGKTYVNFDSKKWNADAYDIMKRFVRMSFEQNPESLKKLLNTGSATLTHVQDKGRWGKDFPKILMEVRTELGGSRKGVQTSLFQLTNEQKGKLDKELERKIKGFLSDIGVRISTVDRITDRYGRPVEAVAKADMLRMIIEVVEGRADMTTLPEEAAHFFVDMLEETPEVQEMIDNIHLYDVYNEVKEEYKDVYKTEREFRKEAVGKLIAKRIIDRAALKPQEESLWKKIWKKIKEIFGLAKAQDIQEFLDEYDRSAYRILEREIDVGNIESKTTQINEGDEIKEGVDFVFKQNPELTSVGTPQQYSQYLNTIFPDSKVKDIVYHGADEKIEYFTLDKKKNKEEKGLFFFGKRKSAQLWRDASFEEENTKQGDLVAAILDLKNPRVEDFENKSAWDMKNYLIANPSKLTKEGKSLLNTTFNKVDNNKAVIYANYLADGEKALKEILDTIARLHIYENFNSNNRKKELLREPVSGLTKLKSIIEDDLKKGISIEQQVKNKIKELSDFSFYNFLETLLKLTDKGAELNEKVSKDFKYKKLSSDIKRQIEEDKKRKLKLIEQLKESGVENYNAILSGDALKSVLEEVEVKISEESIFNNLSKHYRNLLKTQIKEIKENFFIGELSKKGNPTDRNIFNRLTDDFIESFINEGQESITVQFLKDLSNETSINSKTQNLVRELERRLDILKNKKNGHYLMTVLNLKQYNEKVKDFPSNLKENQDGLIATNVDEFYVGRDNQYVVFEPEQIHILGSKQDIEGFKEFVNKEKQNIKQGVSELFESNPELANIGTQEQYSEYLDTIFPDSKVKLPSTGETMIVYHGTNAKFDTFSKEFFGKETVGYLKSKGFWFTHFREEAENYGNVMSVLLNLKNPYIKQLSPTQSEFANQVTDIQYALENNFDGAILDIDEGVERSKGVTEYVAFEPEQIHILGSKQDIEGFRNWIKGRRYTNNEYFQLDSSQKKIIDKLEKDAKGVTKKEIPNDKLDKKVPKSSSGSTERYVLPDGTIVMNRVTDHQQKLFEKKFGKDVADRINESERSRISRETGTILHELVEGFVHSIVKKLPKPAVPSITTEAQYNNLYQRVANLIEQIAAFQKAIDPNGKVRILTEQFVLDPEANLGGSMDIVAIFSDGSASIFDFKFIEFATRQGKVIAEELNPLKEQSYDLQMREYKRILTDVYGVSKLRQTRVIPVNVQYKFELQGDRSIKTTNLSKLETYGGSYLDEVPLADEQTNDAELNKLLGRLFRTKEKLQAKLRTSYDNEALRTRLRNIRKGIRDLQLRGTVMSLLNDVASVVKDISENIDKFSEGEILERLGTLEMYDMIDVYAKDSINNITDPQDKEKTLDRLEKAAFHIKNSVQKLNDRITEIVDQKAQEVGIYNATKPFKEVGNTPFKTLSEYDHPLFRTFYKVLTIAQEKTRLQRNEFAKELEEKVKAVNQWNKGRGINAFEMIINPKTGNLITEMSTKFWEQREKAIEEKNYKWLKENFELTAENKKRLLADRKKKEEDLRKISDDEGYINRILQQWDMKYNPSEDTAYLHKGWSYLTPVKKQENLSEEWKTLLQSENKPLKEFYDFYVQSMDRFREYVPNSGFRRNFIPNIRRDIVEAIAKNGFAAIADIKDMISDSIQVRQEDEDFGTRIDPETGERIYSVPTMYIHPFGDKEYTIKNKSYDLGRSLLLFAEMAMSHKHLSEIEDTVRSIRHVVSISDQLITDKNGKTLLDKTGEFIAGKGSIETLGALDKFINYAVYGQRLQGKSIIGPKGDKIVLKAMAFMGLKTLALNPISSAAALFGAYSNAYMTGAKGRFYTHGAMRRAHTRMISEREKSAAFKEFFELSQDNHTLLKANKMSVSTVAKHATLDKLFIGLRKADQFVEETVLLAVLDKHTIKDGKVLRKTKDERNIWETSEIKDDKLVIKGADGSTLSEEEFLKFRRKLSKILQTIRGNSKGEDISLVQTTLLGRALMQFRTWMPRLVEERFRNARYDQDLDTIELGRYKVFWKEIFSERVVPNIFKLLGDIVTFGRYKREINMKVAKKEFDMFVSENPNILDNFNGDRERAFEEYVESRRSQMRAMAVELRMILAVTGAIIALGLDWDDDGKKDINNYAWGKSVVRILNRFDDELSFFFNPQSFLDLIKNPIPVMNLGVNIWKIFRNSTDEVTDLMFGENSANDQTGWMHYTSRLIPVSNVAVQTYDLFKTEE